MVPVIFRESQVRRHTLPIAFLLLALTGAPSQAFAFSAAVEGADPFPEAEVELTSEDEEGVFPGEGALRVNLADLALGIMNFSYDHALATGFTAGVEGGGREFGSAEKALMAWSLGLRGDWMALGSPDSGALALGVAWRYASTQERTGSEPIRSTRGHRIGGSLAALWIWPSAFTLRMGLRLEAPFALARQGELRDASRLALGGAGRLVPELSAGFSF